jgi:hypothetical protein
MPIAPLNSKAKPFTTLRPVGLELICLILVLKRHYLNLMITARIGTQGDGFGVRYGSSLYEFEESTEESILFGIGIQIEL